jgi:hypothetical protein
VSLQDQQTLISGHEHIGFAVKGDLQNPVVSITIETVCNSIGVALCRRSGVRSGTLEDHFGH